MNKFSAVLALAALSGCCSYSQLQRDVGHVKVDGERPIATYEVVNVSHKLFGVIPLTTGITWKAGDYNEDVGSMNLFRDRCTLDDNLASVRHACHVVGSDKIRNLTGRVDDFYAWSLLFVKKRVIKTSCVICR